MRRCLVRIQIRRPTIATIGLAFRRNVAIDGSRRAFVAARVDCNNYIFSSNIRPKQCLSTDKSASRAKWAARHFALGRRVRRVTTDLPQNDQQQTRDVCRDLDNRWTKISSFLHKGESGEPSKWNNASTMSEQKQDGQESKKCKVTETKQVVAAAVERSERDKQTALPVTVLAGFLGAGLFGVSRCYSLIYSTR